MIHLQHLFLDILKIFLLVISEKITFSEAFKANSLLGKRFVEMAEANPATWYNATWDTNKRLQVSYEIKDIWVPSTYVVTSKELAHISLHVGMFFFFFFFK